MGTGLEDEHPVVRHQLGRSLRGPDTSASGSLRFRARELVGRRQGSDAVGLCRENRPSNAFFPERENKYGLRPTRAGAGPGDAVRA